MVPVAGQDLQWSRVKAQICRFVIWLHSISTSTLSAQQPFTCHRAIILFRLQVSTNHMVDAMASSLVENKLDSVKHLLVLINHMTCAALGGFVCTFCRFRASQLFTQRF